MAACMDNASKGAGKASWQATQPKVCKVSGSTTYRAVRFAKKDVCSTGGQQECTIFSQSYSAYNTVECSTL
jgi:hypothetical protein